MSTDDAAAALLASNRRRRSIRKWIVLGTLPLTLAALLVVGKLLSMYAFAHQTITSYVSADYAGAEAAARGQGVLNWFEPYKAPFNVGTALAEANNLAAARTQLESALALARGLEVCSVRINLSIVLERLGDEARTKGDGVDAAEFYAEALTITTEMPNECNSEQARQQSPDPERDMNETKEDLENRLKQKQQEKSSPEEQSKPEEQKSPEPEQPTPSDDALEKLKDKLEQGAKERDQRQNGDDVDSPRTDKPW